MSINGGEVMYTKYLITGASGFLGGMVAEKLVSSGAEVRCLVLHGDTLEKELPEKAVKVYGDTCDINSLGDFFEGAEKNTCVIHCAGIVSVASAPGRKIYDVNVQGTKNIIYMCKEKNIGKLVYVGSVHAVPELPKGETISETNEYSPDKVSGDYAKSKALASRAVLAAAEDGLNASIVLPTGIIGPKDKTRGSITTMLVSFLSGKLPLAVKGGYDFVDVRDVADGIISCCEKGRKGESYILSGHYSTIRNILETVKQLTGIKKFVYYLPITIAKLFAPLYEKIALRKKKKLFFTPYAVAVLDSNGRFDRNKAEKELSYKPRPLENTLADTIAWLKAA